MAHKQTEKTYYILSLLILIIIPVIIFANTFQNTFVWDDEDLIIENPYIQQLKYTPFLFTPAYWKQYYPAAKGQYRPLWMLSFTADHFVWGDTPWGYHLTNLILHIVNTILVFFLMCLFMENGQPRGSPRPRINNVYGYITPPLISALLFAAHPVHVESVAWIKNRADLLAAMFFLGAFLSFVARNEKKQTARDTWLYVVSLICFIVSLLSKEMGFSLPVVLGVYIVCFMSSREWGKAVFKLIPFFGIAVTYLIFKGVFLSGLPVPAAKPVLSFYTMILIVIKTMGFYLGMLILPLHLTAEHVLMFPQSISDPSVLFSLAGIMILCGLIVVLFQRAKFYAFNMSWILITLLPVSNIIFLSGRPLAEQRLYIPSIGFCCLLGILFSSTGREEVKKIRSTLGGAFFLLFLIMYMTVSFQRNYVWKDPYTLWSTTIQQSPRSPRAHNNLASLYIDEGKFSEARALLVKTIELDPAYAEAYYNFGVLYTAQEKIPEAIASYLKAVEIDVHNARAYSNLGSLYINSGREGEAIKVLTKAVEADPGYADAYANLGAAYDRNGDHHKACDILLRAIDIDASCVRAYNNLGAAYNNINKPDRAIPMLTRAIEINPDYAEAYNNLGAAYIKKGELNKAVDMFRTAIEKDIAYARAYSNLGAAYGMKGQTAEAIHMFEKTIALDPMYGEAYDNLSFVYFTQKDYDRALEYYNKAKEHGFINPAREKMLEEYRDK